MRILLLMAAALSGAERTTSWVEAIPPRVLDFTAHIHKQYNKHYIARKFWLKELEHG